MTQSDPILELLPQSQSTQAVRADRMDARIFQDLKEQSQSLQDVEKMGTEVLKTFPPLTQDIWSSLFKFSPEIRKPEEMAASHMLNSALIEKMTQMQQYKELRIHTRLDDLHSALATITIASELTEQLKKELKEQAEQTNNLQSMEDHIQKLVQAAQTYQDMAAAAKERSQASAAKYEQLSQDRAKQAQALQHQLSQAQAQFEQSCDASANKIRTAMRGAAETALQNAQELSDTMDGWGIGSGTAQNMPIEQKIELAKKLRSEKFKKMAQMIGRLRRLAVHKQKTKLNQARDEVHSVEMGNDLARVLPSELALLRHPLAKQDFKRRFIEGKLMQYELTGKEKEGKGPIICCVDNSGSVAGAREIWSKAVALALLEIAIMQKRSYACIHFGGPTDPPKVIEVQPKDTNVLTKAIEIAEYFLNGGTDFQPPLEKAVQLIENSVYNKADVVFITDGDAPIQDKFLAAFLDIKKKKDFKLISVLIQSHMKQTLERFSDTIIDVTELLESEAEPLLEI